MNDNNYMYYFIPITLMILVLLVVIYTPPSQLITNTQNSTLNCEECSPIIINKTKIIEKIVIQEKDCPICNISAQDKLDLTLPYIRQVKRLDRQLDECLWDNSSYFNRTKEDLLDRCQSELNHTKTKIGELEVYLK